MLDHIILCTYRIQILDTYLLASVCEAYNLSDHRGRTQATDHADCSGQKHITSTAEVQRRHLPAKKPKRRPPDH